MDIAYAAHTDSVTLMLDHDGVCRWVAPGPGTVEMRVPDRIVGAQFVASLDIYSARALDPLPQVGLPMLFATVDDTGRVALVRTGPLLRFDDMTTDSGVRAAPCEASRPAMRPSTASYAPPPVPQYFDDGDLTVPRVPSIPPPRIASQAKWVLAAPPPPRYIGPPVPIERALEPLPVERIAPVAPIAQRERPLRLAPAHPVSAPPPPPAERFAYGRPAMAPPPPVDRVAPPQPVYLESSHLVSAPPPLPARARSTPPLRARSVPPPLPARARSTPPPVPARPRSAPPPLPARARPKSPSLPRFGTVSDFYLPARARLG